jgi:hypothetical protein
MKKRSFIVVGLVLALSTLVAGSAFARWGGYGGMMGGYDMMGGYSMGYDRNVDVDAVRKFQSETLKLRDELFTVRLELDAEYSKVAPNANRISTLRKDMIDIEAKIMTTAEKYDMRAYNRGDNNRWGNRGCW